MKGMIRWKVQKDGLTIRESSSPYSNMILNQGLDFIADYSFAACFNYCAIGSGVAEPIKTDKGLADEIRRTDNVSLSANSNGTSLVNNVYMMYRTFVFEPILEAKTYGEMGFSPLAASSNNLFSKALFKNSSGVAQTVLVNPGEVISIRYELSIEIYDGTKNVSQGISGVSSSGVLKFQKVGLKAVNATGGITDFDDTQACNEPSVQARIFISDSSLPPEPFNQCVDRSPGYDKMGSLSTYATSAYQRKKGVMFIPSELPDSFRSVGVGRLDSHGTVFVFNGEQTPPDGKAYVVNFTYIWVYQSPSNFEVWLDSEDAVYLHPRVKKVNSYAYFAL